MYFTVRVAFTACVYTLLCGTLGVLAVDCPVTGTIELPLTCKCESDMVECSDLDTFPPADTMTAFKLITFRKCNFPNIEKLEYNDADELMIISSLVQNISDNAFSTMTFLTLLVLTSNELTEVRPAMFNGLEALTRLTLTSNKLTNIGEKAFNTLPKLDDLELSLNKVNLSENTFQDHPTLTKINLVDCGLTSETIPIAALSKVSLLEHLNLDRNNLGQIPEKQFSSLSSLVALRLDSCELTKLHEDSFDNLKKLTVLDLSNNHLTTIPEDSLDDPKDTLRTFYVDSNQLVTLDDDLLDWEDLKHVRLGHNLWQCDCGIWFMKQMDLAHVDPENVTCTGPEEFAGQLVSNLTSDQICSSKSSGKNTVILAIAIPIVIVCVLLIGYYIYKIVQNRRNKEDRKSVRYSSVYKDTTEATPKGHSPGGGAPTSVL